MKKLKFIIPLILIILSLCVLTYELLRDKRVELESDYYGKSGFIETTSDDFNKLIENKESFIFFTHNDYCNFKIPTDTIIEKYMKEKNFSIIKIPFENFKNTEFYTIIKYAPSVGIVSNGKLVKFLDANLDEDLPRYQDVNELGIWIEESVKMK